MARAYYNEIDPAAAHILRAMIDADVIMPGDVDTRSIKEVKPDDVRGYTQCHFFAGGGFWSIAARLAGWPDDRELWTGSCPCQPFSAAGKGLGTDDPRHLWPDFYRLIRARRPAVVMGEQVAGKAGYGWFDGVRADLAREDFASRPVDFPACSVDAPHQRNRLYWIAVANRESDERGAGLREDREEHDWDISPNRARVCPACGGRGRMGPFWPGGISTICANCTTTVALGDGSGQRFPGRSVAEIRRGNLRQERPAAPASDAGNGSLPSDAYGHRCDGARLSARPQWERGDVPARSSQRNRTYWSDAEWIVCHDGKARRAQSGIRLLVDGLPGRVDLWRVGGNAIVPEAAAEVIAAFMDVYGVPERRAA